MAKIYLLDTCVCISILRNKDGIREKVKSIGLDKCFISEITIAELCYGASKSGRKAEKIKDVEQIAKMFTIIPAFNSFQLYGDEKTRLESEGMRIDDFDLLIGTSAVYNNMVMVTYNTKHFERIHDIKIENWIAL